MQKFVFLLLVASVTVGALMPSQPRAPAAPTPVEERRRPLQVAQPTDTQPSTIVEVGSGSVTLKRAEDGHFYAEAQVNGAPIEFLVDTGATAIALSRDDARRASVETDPESDEVIGSGASGAVTGQMVTLERVSLGPMQVQNVSAAVLSGGKQSLLGQSFLGQFNSVTIEGDTMVLR